MSPFCDWILALLGGATSMSKGKKLVLLIGQIKPKRFAGLEIAQGTVDLARYQVAGEQTLEVWLHLRPQFASNRAS